MNRDMQTKRAFDRAKALHKKRLALAIYGRDYYTHFNQYAKGKIHCGCPLCSTKTNVKGRKTWLSHKDLQSMARMATDMV